MRVDMQNPETTFVFNYLVSLKWGSNQHSQRKSLEITCIPSASLLKDTWRDPSITSSPAICVFALDHSLALPERMRIVTSMELPRDSFSFLFMGFFLDTYSLIWR